MEKPFYREIASGIIRWAREVSMDENHGATRVLLLHFDIEAQGEMHHDPSRNVLFVAREPEILARELELKPQEVIQQLESAKRKLSAVRKKRKMPFVDQTLYSNWNGRSLRERELKDFALKTLNRFREEGFHPESGMMCFLDENGTFQEGLLEDQVEMLAASLEAFELTTDTVYLDFSEKLVRVLLDRFWAEDGGFLDIPTPKKEGHLRFRQRRIQDSPVCSPNATATVALLKLYHLTQQAEYLEKARAVLQFFHQEAKASSYFASGYVNALDFYLKGPVKVSIVGEKEDPLFQSLYETASLILRPYSLVVPLTQECRAFALVCAGKICQPMTDDPAELERQILRVS